MDAICVIKDSCNSSIQGYILFEQRKQNTNETLMIITVKLSGLTPGKHGFHIHEKGNLMDMLKGTNGCSSLCAHFNPDNKLHGDISDTRKNRHAGDLGNIIADKNGNVNQVLIDKVIRTNFSSKYCIIGRSVVIHEKEDDLGVGGLDSDGTIINENIYNESIKTGNAGKRIACGVIGIK